MIHPFLPFPVFGAIWYQGESNQGNANLYDCAINAMVTDWRTKWNQRNPEMDITFPFGQVQLAPNTDVDRATGFPDVRWTQADRVGYNPTASMEKFFMAVAVDLPDFNSTQGSIHPRYKRQIADRLALGAFQVAYGTTTAGIYQGPIPTGYSIDGSNVRITYGMNLQFRTTTGNELFEFCCGASPTATCTAGGQWTVTSFVAGNNQDVALANPCSTGQSVTGFRYLWRESPCKTLESCPIYSVENNLPAPPYVYNGLISTTKIDI
jgi:sialate O-acetylesterase